MKKRLLAILLALALCLSLLPMAVFATPVAGDVQIKLTDSYGDGWNGAALKVYKDSSLLETYTVSSGSSASYTLTYDPSSTYDFTWSAGPWDGECGITITLPGETDAVYSKAGMGSVETGTVLLQLTPDGPVVPESPEIPVEGEITVYFTDTLNWGDPQISISAFRAYLGEDSHGRDVYSYTFDSTYVISFYFYTASVSSDDIYTFADGMGYYCLPETTSTGWHLIGTYTYPDEAPGISSEDDGQYTLVLCEGSGYKNDCAGTPVDLSTLGISYINGVYTFNGLNFVTSAPVAVYIHDEDAVVELAAGSTNVITSTYSGLEMELAGLEFIENATIRGTGSLTATSGKNLDTSYNDFAYSHGILCDEKLIIESGNVTGIGGFCEYGESYGIYAGYDMEVHGGNVTGIGADYSYDSYGIYAYYDLDVYGGTIVATGGDSAGSDSVGLYVDDYCNIYDGSVTATGGNGSWTSIGLHVEDGLYIEDGNMTGNGGDSIGYGSSYGVYTEGDIYVDGGTLTGNGGDSDYCCGIYVDYGYDMYIYGGTVTGIGGSSYGGASTGIYVEGTLELYAGDITGIGGISEIPEAGQYGISCYELYISEDFDGSVLGQALQSSYGNGLSAFFINIGAGPATFAGTAYAVSYYDYDLGSDLPTSVLTADGISVTAGPNANGTNSALLTDWLGDGTDDTSDYRYMHFDGVGGGDAPILEGPIFFPGMVEDLPFDDVQHGDWYFDSVQYVYQYGLMSGTGSRTFAPDETLTRAMVWTILARMDGVNTAGGKTWYAAGQAWAIRNGISDGTNPGDPITREQFATILYRYAQYKGFSAADSADLSAFADASDVSEYAEEALQWAVGAGIMNGSGSKLNPKGNTSRAEAATMLMRFGF